MYQNQGTTRRDCVTMEIKAEEGLQYAQHLIRLEWAIYPSSSSDEVYENNPTFQVFVQYFTNKKLYYPIPKPSLIFWIFPYCHHCQLFRWAMGISISWENGKKEIMGRPCDKELWDRRLPNTNQAHFHWTCIRMKNRLERNYSSMGQVRTGKKQLKVTVYGDESGSDLDDDELTRQNLPYFENHSLRMQ